MTAAEIQIEAEYRREERLGILGQDAFLNYAARQIVDRETRQYAEAATVESELETQRMESLARIQRLAQTNRWDTALKKRFGDNLL